MNNESQKVGTSQARQLAESDDISSGLVLDTMLGFTTHKMAGRFRPLKVDQEIVKKALERYAKSDDTEQAYREIVFNAGDWGRCYFLTKSKSQVAAFKEHVSVSSSRILLTVKVLFFILIISIVLNTIRHASFVRILDHAGINLYDCHVCAGLSSPILVNAG